ncbi:uncharacterized protein [Dermacentor albipictus]|uniref:uncharacterized protein n=1 Tax=Dermacentor albipictus TaxID=60249 RepID=UPI0031FDEFB5
MQESKRKQQNQVLVKKQQLTAVLEQHTRHVLLSNGTAAGKTVAAPKRKRTLDKDFSDSSDDETLVTLLELKNSENEAKFWKSWFKLESQHSASLKRHINFLEKKVEQQMTSFQQTVEDFISQPCRCGNGRIRQRSIAAELPKAASEPAPKSARGHEKPWDSMQVGTTAAPTPPAVLAPENDCTGKAVEKAAPAQTKQLSRWCLRNFPHVMVGCSIFQKTFL